MKTSYKSDIVLGDRYRDDQTGIEGTAVALTFYQYACERVVLEVVVAGKIEEYAFDSPRVTSVKNGQTATTERTGGPGRTATGLDPAARR